jgi:hypothetical protein
MVKLRREDSGAREINISKKVGLSIGRKNNGDRLRVSVTARKVIYCTISINGSNLAILLSIVRKAQVATLFETKGCLSHYGTVGIQGENGCRNFAR